MTVQPGSNQEKCQSSHGSHVLHNAILNRAPIAMKRDVEEPPIVTTPPAEAHGGGRRFVGNPLFVLLIAVAAVAGALSGLLLVYSTDLPQVTELEQFRPSTIRSEE